LPWPRKQKPNCWAAVVNPAAAPLSRLAVPLLRAASRSAVSPAAASRVAASRAAAPLLRAASRPAVRPLPRLAVQLLLRPALLSRLAVPLLLAAITAATAAASRSAVSPVARSRVAARAAAARPAAVPLLAAATKHQGSRGLQAINDLVCVLQRNGPLELSSGPFSFLRLCQSSNNQGNQESQGQPGRVDPRRIVMNESNYPWIQCDAWSTATAGKTTTHFALFIPTSVGQSLSKADH